MPTANPKNSAPANNALTRRALRLAAEFDAAPNPDVIRLLSRDILRDTLLAGDALPLGTSIYKTSKGHDIIHGRVYELDTVRHTTADGRGCEHRLYVDAGALYSVEPHPVHGHLTKTAKAECTAVRTEKTATGHEFVYDWTLPCGETQLEYTTRWQPDPTRYHHDDEHRRPRTKAQAAMTELRPTGQADEARFATIHGRRNDAESYNAWAKGKTTHFGRAASNTLEGQRLDFLMIGMLNNALTWKRR